MSKKKRNAATPRQHFIAGLAEIGRLARAATGVALGQSGLEAQVLPVERHPEIIATFLRAYWLKHHMDRRDWAWGQVLLEGALIYMQMSRHIQGDAPLEQELLTAELRHAMKQGGAT